MNTQLSSEPPERSQDFAFLSLITARDRVGVFLRLLDQVGDKDLVLDGDQWTLLMQPIREDLDRAIKAFSKAPANPT
jgi:hypothetical protein